MAKKPTQDDRGKPDIGAGAGNAYIYDENYFGPNHVTSYSNGQTTEFFGDEADAAWANRDASGKPQLPGRKR